jgi:hypothetical protein
MTTIAAASTTNRRYRDVATGLPHWRDRLSVGDVRLCCAAPFGTTCARSAWRSQGLRSSGNGRWSRGHGPTLPPHLDPRPAEPTGVEANGPGRRCSRSWNALANAWIRLARPEARGRTRSHCRSLVCALVVGRRRPRRGRRSRERQDHAAVLERPVHPKKLVRDRPREVAQAAHGVTLSDPGRAGGKDGRRSRISPGLR